MLIKRSVLFSLALIIIALSLSCVSAHESGNFTGDVSGQMMSDSDNEISEAIADGPVCLEGDCMTGNSSGQVICDIGSFEDLVAKVNATPEGATLILDMDYEYVNGTNKGVLISNSITVDGAGHTLNGNELSRMFNITADNVTIRNINFINGNAFGRYGGIAGGGAIYWSGTNGFIENCTFTNNAGRGIEDDPFDKEETFVDENGNVIHVIRVRPMGAKINEGGAIVWNGTNGTVSKCIFTKNDVGYPNSGGAICWRGHNGKIIGSQFYENGAWCGSAVCWIGDNGTILSSIIANSTFFDGGIYWFGANGTVHDSILIDMSSRGLLRPFDCNVDADYNFWGDALENPNSIQKIGSVSNWLVIKFSSNGQFVKKGEVIVIKYDITTLTDKNGNMSAYDALSNYSSQFTYRADKTGFLNITFKNGKINVEIDTRNTVTSRDLTAYYASRISYSVWVHDASGNVTGKRVKFTIANRDYYATTDNNGIATLNINLKPGNYAVCTSYAGVKVKNKITVKTTLITKNLSKKVKKMARFNVKVLNSKGKAYAKQIVKISFNGKLFKIRTNSKGIATLYTSKNLKAGKYIIKTACNGLTNTNVVIVRR